MGSSGQLSLQLGEHKHQRYPHRLHHLRPLPLRQHLHGEPLLQRQHHPLRHPSTKQQPRTYLRSIYPPKRSGLLMEKSQHRNAAQDKLNQQTRHHHRHEQYVKR